MKGSVTLPEEGGAAAATGAATDGAQKQRVILRHRSKVFDLGGRRSPEGDEGGAEEDRPRKKARTAVPADTAGGEPVAAAKSAAAVFKAAGGKGANLREQAVLFRHGSVSFQKVVGR